MKAFFICKMIAVAVFVTAITLATAQTQISPKYSVDAEVNTLTSLGDTLIVGGNFYNVGVYTGGAALFTTTSDQPQLNFPKIIGNIKSSTPDGAGGYYIYGNFRKESENASGFSYPRIEHILPNFTFESGFSLPVDALFGVYKLLYHNGFLYVGGSYMSSINGQAAGDLAVIDVATKLVQTWTPAVTITYLGGITNLYIAQNTLYIMGGFTDVGNQPRRNIAAIELYTGAVKPWNFAANFTDAQSYTDIKSYKNQVIVSGGFSTGGTPQEMEHACAKADTATGALIQYIFKAGGLFGNGIQYLYFAAGVSTMAISGDVLYTFSSGTFDTRVTAVDLAGGNTVKWAKYFNMIANATEMEVSGGALFVGGSNFTDLYTTNQPNDATNFERKIKGAVKLNTATGDFINWMPDPVLGKTVTTLHVQGSNVFIGGDFTHVNSLERNGILMLKASTQQILPFSITLFGHSVRDFKIMDTTLYAAGAYLYIDGTYQPKSIMAFSLRTGNQTSFNPPYLGTAYTIEANAQHIFLGGDLTEPAGGADRTRLFAVNRVTGALSTWAPNPNQTVSALHLSEGKLYAGGSFTRIADTTRNYLAGFDTATLNLTSWNPNPDWLVYSISSAYGTIWIGGLFIHMNGVDCYNIAGISAQSGLVQHKPLASYAGPSGVNDILVKGCSVIFSSPFRISSTDNCNNLFIYNQYNKSMVSSSAFCQNINDLSGNVQTLTTIGNDLYFGGSFNKVNGKANATHIERISFPAGYFNDCGEYISVQNGNWNVGTTWQAGSVPPADARVRVRHAVVVPQAANCFSLSVEQGGVLSVNNGVQMKVLN